MPTAEALCHSQHTLPTFHRSIPARGTEGGGGAGMLAGAREKEVGAGGGSSGMKASAMMLRRGKEYRYPPFWQRTL